MRADGNPDDVAQREKFVDDSLQFMVFLSEQVLKEMDGDKFLQGDDSADVDTAA